MYIFLLMVMFVVQLVLSFNMPTQNYNIENNVVWPEIVAQSDLNSDTEELIYNWKVYLDEEYVSDEDLLDINGTEKNAVTESEPIITTDIKTNNYSNTNNKNSENYENISSLEESDEEEIVFYDNFDTWYWEDLVEIWE